MTAFIRLCARRGHRRARRRPAVAAVRVVATTEDLGLARSRGRRREGHGRRARKGVSGSAFRRSQAELHPRGQPRRPADRRRPRARDRLAASAHHQRTQRQDSAGRRRVPRCFANVKILEIPTGQITRAMGDVHPQGNPHYWLDPANGRRIAQTIKDKLSQLAPADRAYFEQRYADFDRRLAAAESALGRDHGAVQGHARSSPTIARGRTSWNASG